MAIGAAPPRPSSNSAPFWGTPIGFLHSSVISRPARAVRSPSFTSHRHSTSKHGSGSSRNAAGERLLQKTSADGRSVRLFYGQYQRTSEVCFLLEPYVFYEAIIMLNATDFEELPSDGILLICISASGKTDGNVDSQKMFVENH